MVTILLELCKKREQSPMGRVRDHEAGEPIPFAWEETSHPRKEHQVKDGDTLVRDKRNRGRINPSKTAGQRDRGAQEGLDHKQLCCWQMEAPRRWKRE